MGKLRKPPTDPIDEHWGNLPEARKTWYWSRESVIKPDAMRHGAQSALNMARVIRDLLPTDWGPGILSVQGGGAGSQDVWAIAAAYEQAAADYISFERIRNPLGFPWPYSPWFTQLQSTKRGITYWESLCSAMRAVCEHYAWQGFSKRHWLGDFASPIESPNWPVSRGIAVPPIPAATLERVEKAAGGLVEAAGGPGAQHGEPPAEPATHSPDFRSVNWFGVQYDFSANQAAVVKTLWQAWEQGSPGVGHDTLLEAAESAGGRLDLVFRSHPAWKTMIAEGGTRGTRRLKPPE